VEGADSVQVVVEACRLTGDASRMLDESAVAFDQALAAIEQLARRAGQSLADLGPEQIELTFGLELSGGVDLPLVAKVTAKGSMQVTLTWAHASSGLPERSLTLPPGPSRRPAGARRGGA
jgi:hypothetical protein